MTQLELFPIGSRLVWLAIHAYQRTPWGKTPVWRSDAWLAGPCWERP